MLEELGAWWDGVELWVVQLWFPVQFAVVMSLVIPVCLGAAWFLDLVVDRASSRLRARGE